MRIPFTRELDETFRTDAALWKKMAGAAFVASFVVASVILKTLNPDDPLKVLLAPSTLVALVIVALSGALVALMISFKDVIVRRIGRGEPVNLLLRLYFGMGVWSLVAWFPTGFILGILLIIILAIL